MKLYGWSIDGFGVFRDYEVRGIGDGLTVLIGPNEAGKSTLLGFLRGTLFGFGDGRSRDPRYPPLRGGRHGGRVFVTDGRSDGHYVIERYVGRKPPVRVLLPDGREGTEADLRALVGGADDRLFRNIFAFSLAELQSFDSLSEEGVRDRIFSAGIAGAGRSAREAMRELERRAGALLKSRAQAPINTLAAEIARVTAQLDDARGHAAHYVHLLREEDRLAGEIARLADEADNLRRALARCHALCELWPVWDELRSIEAELSAVPVIDEFPDDGEARLTATIHELRTTEEALTNQWRLRDVAQGELDELVADDRLAAVHSDVEQLHETLALHRSLLQQLPASRMKLSQTRDTVDERLRALGPDWNESRLDAFDRSIPRLEEVRAWETRLQRADREADRLRNEAESGAKNARQLETAADRLLQHPEREQPDETLVAEQSRLLRRLRANLSDLRAEEAKFTAQDGIARDREGTVRLLQPSVRRVAPRWPAAAAWLVAALAIAVGSAGGNAASRAAVAGGSIVVAGAVTLLVWQRRRRTGVEHQRQETELSILRDERDQAIAARDIHGLHVKELAARVGSDAVSLGLPQRPAAELVEERDAELARAHATVQEWREQHDRLLHARYEAASARAEFERLDNLAREAAAAFETERRAWEAWKREAGLPESLSPQGVLDYFEAIRLCRDAMLSRKAAADETLRIAQQVGWWEGRARTALLAAGGKVSNLETERLIEALLVLRQRCIEDRNVRATRHSLEREIQDLTGRIPAMESALARARNDWEQLLQSAGATDEATLRQRLHDFRRRSMLKQRASDLERQIAGRIGRGPEADAIRNELAGGAVAEWQHRAAAVERDLDALQGCRDGVVRRQRDASRAREELESSADIVRLEAELEGLRSELGAATREWRTVMVARALIDETLREFERTRQPAVLTAASDMFSFVTGGRYTRVVQEEGGEQIAVVDRSGSGRHAETLSRGTAEQLYLCIRLALASEFARRSAPLPLVMDDVLVNMDPERSRRIAEVLTYVAREHQVLLFTCHPATCKLLLELEPAAGYLHLQAVEPLADPAAAAQPDLWTELAVEPLGTTLRERS